MNKSLLNVLGLGILGVLASCGGDDPLPLPVVDFEASTELEVFEIINPIEFTNNTTNASTYLWEFGDGETSTEVNPEHSYTEPGSYTVTLTAMTDDDQSESSTLDITVGSRFLTFIVVNDINFQSTDADGNVGPWDADSGPDVILIFGPEEDTDFDETIVSPILSDIEEVGFTGFQLELQDGLELSNEDWVFAMLDDDSDIAENTFETMVQSNPFNPVTNSNTTINPDTNAGLVQITGGGFDLLFLFEIR